MVTKNCSHKTKSNKDKTDLESDVTPSPFFSIYKAADLGCLQKNTHKLLLRFTSSPGTFLRAGNGDTTKGVF